MVKSWDLLTLYRGTVMYASSSGLRLKHTNDAVHKHKPAYQSRQPASHAESDLRSKHRSQHLAMDSSVRRRFRQFRRCVRNLDSFTDGQARIVDYDEDQLTYFRVELAPNSGLYKGGKYVFKVRSIYNYWPPTHRLSREHLCHFRWV